jgi:hypothetical protein
MQVLSDKVVFESANCRLRLNFQYRKCRLGSSFNSFAAPGLEILTSKSKQSGITTLSMWRADSFGFVFSFLSYILSGIS